ncbi:outer membrane protein assembly factor BamA [Tateyamaria omphalii]|uniref:outer membrane protein assembly factor BamA n=1 Tax=Tateyamaria omphalii TaxID=299262 RepID=UPI001C99496E|nr:outer membrane protein assembly factor BamA [Tateyamaria omphalii]MBY5932792.1 outer membrane protein assembly factor BamA [Tateyamaria omphalii]
MAQAQTCGRKAFFRAAIFVLVSVSWVASLAPAQAQSFQFSRIVVDGNQRVGDAAVIARAGIAPGQTLTAGQVNAARQNLENSGLFETVSVAAQGSTLLITVTEFPTINRISFEGNRRVDDEALSATVQSQERRVFSPAQAERDAGAIAEAYSSQGRVAARVTPRIIRRTDNRVDLVFEIFEGDVVEVERISFVGNRVYSDRRLRRVLDTKQAGFFRALIQTDTLVEDRIQFDQQVLTDFYNSRGYVDFRVVSSNAQLTEERDGFFLTFNVQEGQQFSFGDISVTSEIPSVDGDAYQELVRVRPGVIYSPTLVETEITRLERQGQRDGVDFLRVEPRITRNDRELTLDVEFVISRGPRVFVERIDIEGNTTTLDRVIRRQFRVAEGDPFNPREIRDAAERIRALSYFSVADVNAREGSTPEQVVIDVDVEEQPTGSLNFGGAFSQDDGFGLLVSFTERNFLGRGQTLGFNFSTAEESEQYGITFVEPAFLGRDVAFGLNLQYSETDSSFANYDTESLVFRPSLTFPVSERARLQINYNYLANEQIARDPVENGTIVQREIDAGEQAASSIGYTYTYDTREGGLNPNAGVLFEFSQDFAGIGGDAEFIRTRGRIVGQRLAFNEEVTLRASLEAGYLAWNGGTNRTVDRFILGPNIIRGFEPGGIGPRDLNTAGDDPDPLGGNIFVAARFEAEFPLGLPEELGIRGGLFYDVGNLWDLDSVDLSGGNVVGEGGSFRHVIGFSILWDTAIGPLRLNFSNALKKEEFDREQSFDLTISTTF